MVSQSSDDKTTPPREAYQPTPHVCQTCDHPLSVHDELGVCTDRRQIGEYVGRCACESGATEGRWRMWIVSLNALDAEAASFRHVDPSGGPSTAEFAVPRSEWESMGRPARLGITVRPEGVA